MGHEDEGFKRLAQGYAQQLGEETRKELDALQAAGYPTDTRRLDRRVLGQTTQRRRKTGWIAGVVAAALLLTLVPMAVRNAANPQRSDTAQSDTHAPDMAAEATGAPDITAEAPSDSDTAAKTTGTPEMTGTPETTDDTDIPAVLVALSALPEGFSIADSWQDHGQSIYRLANAAQDDVVVTLEPGGQQATRGLTPVTVLSTPAWATANADYALLTYQQGNVLVTMTCRYDVNTLVALGTGLVLAN